MATKNTSESNFVKKVLSSLNKDEKTKQLEVIQDTLEDYVIECNGQIANLKNVQIPSKEAEVTRANREVEKAKKTFENARFSVNGDFSNYVSVRNDAEYKISRAESNVKGLQSELDYLNKQLAKFEEVLIDFQS